MDINILLHKLAAPAHRAIQSTGVATLEDLAFLSKAEVSALHGIGSNALAVIIATLAEHGLTLAKG